MKKLLGLGAAVLGLAFLGQPEAKADNCDPRATVVVRGGYPVYAPVYYGGYSGYGYYHQPYRRHYVRYIQPNRAYRLRVAYSYGY